MTLAFEILEQKNLLAGDVSVHINGTTLEIVGDGHDNTVLVSPHACPNFIHIHGVDTSINGSDYMSVPVDGVDQMMVKMGAGNDLISLGGVSLDMDVDIDLGNGAMDPDARNLVLFDDIDILGDLDIRGDVGRDSVMFLQSSAVNASIQLGSVHDSVNIRNSLFTGNLNVDLGSGPDFVHMVHSEVLGDASILGGEGQDQIFVRWAGFVHNDLLLDGGAGDQDRLGDLLIQGGSGNQDRLVVPCGGGDIAAGGDITISNLELSGVMFAPDIDFFNRLNCGGVE